MLTLISIKITSFTSRLHHIYIDAVTLTLCSVYPPDAVAVGVGLEEKLLQELPELDAPCVVWGHGCVGSAGCR